MKYFILFVFIFAVSCSLEKFERPVADSDVDISDESSDLDDMNDDMNDEADDFDADHTEDDSDIVISDINGVICTGQTKCYSEYLMTACPPEESDYFGTDGYYAAKGTCIKRNLAAVGSDPEKTVIDSNTGFEWIRDLSKDKYDWEGAVKYCADSEYAGYSDWRLPDHKELRTLVYYGKDISPVIEDDVFPSTPESFFWTSSVDAADSMYSWYVDFMYGTSGKMGKKGLNYVRCVRSNTLPENSFNDKIVKNDRIISDQTTKLIWSSTVFPVKTWREALVYCKDLNYGGSASWRLPSANELISLVDIRERKPASLFPDLPFEKFWSSTTDSSYYSQFAVAVDFESGSVAGEVKTDENYVICVTGEDQKHDGKCISDNGCPEGELCADGFCYGHDTECGIGDACKDGYNCIKNKCYEKNAFVSTWSDDGTGITIPLVSSGSYNFVVLWGDGTIDSIKTWNDPALTHKYKKEGDHTVQIIGTLIGWQFCDESQVTELCASSNSLKIKEINQWGAMYLGLTKLQFAGCSNLDVLALDAPDLTKTLDLSGAFAGCTSLTGGDSFKNWNVSQIRNMAGMFYKAGNFNADISGWNVQNVESMSGMFMEAGSFDNDISKWNTDSVYNMENMFHDAFSFNADISDWNVSDVISMKGMFYNAYSFNGDLSGWDVSRVTDMSSMFYGVTLSTANYDAILNGWSELMLQNDVDFSGGNSKYSSAGEAARAKIINDFNWTITDGGKE